MKRWILDGLRRLRYDEIRGAQGRTERHVSSDTSFGWTKVQEWQATSLLAVRQIQLAVLRGPRKGSRYLLDGAQLRVGKADDNDLVIPDETVSRHHFEIVRDIRGFLLRDLDSTNGTRLDGAAIREAYIRPGAVLTAGAAKLRFLVHETTPVLDPVKDDFLRDILGPAPLSSAVRAAVAHLADLDLPVLVRGEPGTGKHEICHAIHARRHGANGPPVVIDARDDAQISRQLGSGQPPKAFREAHGGTLILLEPWELPMNLQTRLCRSLEKVHPPRNPPPADRPAAAHDNAPAKPLFPPRFRLLATATRDLHAEVRKNKMDPLLAHYLTSCRLFVPPLRERSEDSVFLFRSLLQPDDHTTAQPAGHLPAFLLDLIERHVWPGNATEIKTFGRAWRETRRTLEEKHEVDWFPPFDENKSFRQHKGLWIDRFEKAYLRWLITRCAGNVSEAARKARMDRKHLNNLLKKHGLKK